MIENFVMNIKPTQYTTLDTALVVYDFTLHWLSDNINTSDFVNIHFL